MSKRKCIYTGLNADQKDRFIPSHLADEERQNWTNGVPCSSKYKEYKQGRGPNDLETQAFEIFSEIELLRIKLKSLEIKQDKVQAKLIANMEKHYKTKNDKVQKKEKAKKEVEIQKAYKQKEINDTVDNMLEEIIEKKKKTLEW